jgi:hypothetical protein
MSWLQRWVLLGLLLCVACDQPGAVDAPTQIMLRIHNDDAALLSRMTDLRVSLFRREGATWLGRGSHLHSMRQLRWPVEIPILPSTDAAATKDFEVLIEALAGSQVLAETRVVSGFTPGEWRILDATLFSCPRPVELPACAPAGCHAEECALCTPSGDCTAVERVNPRDQKPFDASYGVDAGGEISEDANGLALPGAEAGGSLLDAGVQRDASSGALDAATPSDTGVGMDAGSVTDTGSSSDTGSNVVDAASDPVDSAVQDPCDAVTCVQGAVCSNVSGVARCMCNSGF